MMRGRVPTVTRTEQGISRDGYAVVRRAGGPRWLQYPAAGLIAAGFRVIRGYWTRDAAGRPPAGPEIMMAADGPGTGARVEPVCLIPRPAVPLRAERRLRKSPGTDPDSDGQGRPSDPSPGGGLASARARAAPTRDSDSGRAAQPERLSHQHSTPLRVSIARRSGSG